LKIHFWGNAKAVVEYVKNLVVAELMEKLLPCPQNFLIIISKAGTWCLLSIN
jgi:hypothetical protein